MKAQTSKHIYDYCFQQLMAIEERERKSLIYLLLEDAYGISKTDIVLGKEVEINNRKLDNQLIRLQNHEPVQQIVGFAYFRDRKFIVSPDVLIPRPETEELIDIVKANCSAKPSILDIGTGTGCIAISLALEIKIAQVTGLDLSKRALAIAQKNASDLNAKLGFIQTDFLSYVSKEKYDILVSNPPYIRNLEKPQMHANVLNFEPDMALFVADNDPLIFYKAIAKFGQRQLNKNGFIVVEINSFLGQETAEVFKEYGYSDVQLIRDFYAKDRFVLARN